jgi:hypothetical protein
MRKIIATSILVFIICTAFNKPQKTITDYRDAYTGTYFCQSACNTLSGNRERGYIVDTLRIIVVKDKIDSVLQISFGNQVTKVKLLNKILQAYPRGGYYSGKFFSADSLDFIFNLSRASSCKYKGKKK